MPPRPGRRQNHGRGQNRRLTAIGVTCGIGSMLIGARQAGFRVLGNIEWRRYFHIKDEKGRNTFSTNFPGSVFCFRIEDLDRQTLRKFTGCDLAMGHPECGNFSQLQGVNKTQKTRLKDPVDIPLFVDLVARLKPRFFVMDDLPKSLGAFTIMDYVTKLPEYDLFPEWVSNWGYGNVQKFRKRFFMIGARKKEKFCFQANEKEPIGATTRSVIEGLDRAIPNHDPIAMDELAQKNLSLRYIGDRPTWREVGEFAKENWVPGEAMTYYANDGTIKRKPGCKIEYWDGPASVQDGRAYKIHPISFRPFTIREHMRIQGFPDTFIVYGVRLNKNGEYNPDRNINVTRQVGKAMPIQFCRYVARQIRAHIRGQPFRASNLRIINPNPFVDEAKLQYCRQVGYSHQKQVCRACWLCRTCPKCILG